MNLTMRRRHTDQVEQVEPVEAEVVEVPAQQPDESATLRALRAQVRALEQALEVAPDVPAPARDDAAYRRRVQLAARAVAARAQEHDDPRHTAARVAAAIERLDAAGFARPALPGVATTRAIAAPPRLSAIAARPATQETAPEVAPGDEVVVPVPPPAAEEPRRGRRRIRHTAA